MKALILSQLMSKVAKPGENIETLEVDQDATNLKPDTLYIVLDNKAVPIGILLTDLSLLEGKRPAKKNKTAEAIDSPPEPPMQFPGIEVPTPNDLMEQP